MYERPVLPLQPAEVSAAEAMAWRTILALCCRNAHLLRELARNISTYISMCCRKKDAVRKLQKAVSKGVAYVDEVCCAIAASSRYFAFRARL